VDEAQSLRVECAGIGDLARIRSFVMEAAASLEADRETVPDLVIAVDEAATNIIRHGYETRGGPIEVDVRRDGDAIVVRLIDDARSFDPTVWPPPDLDVPLARRSPGGLGIHLVRRSVDRMVHRSRPGAGNELILVKDARAQRR
jgi:serine/threonine-protein kinase RsbW